MQVVGPDLQREAVATGSSVAKYRFSDGRDLLLESLGQGEIARCTRYDDEEDWAGGHLDSERLPNIKPHEGVCDGRHHVFWEVAHWGSETSPAGREWTFSILSGWTAAVRALAAHPLGVRIRNPL